MRYYKNLKKNNNLFIPKPKNNYSKNIYWVVGVVIMNKKLKLDAKKVMTKLRKNGIDTRPFFWPMHKQKIFKKMKIFKKIKYPNSSYLGRYGFYIPSYPQISKADMDFVISKVNRLLKN